MNVRKIQFIMSIAFVAGYFVLLGLILFIEASDTVNMKKGDNSMMGEFKILIGVMTGAVAQILNFWFNKNDYPEGPKTLPITPTSAGPIAVTVPVVAPTNVDDKA
ncbi:MAG: hypothetical protein HRT58_16215 [Crocinitomicaceae bacterium]|nr:hypothetical protein [Flavobacteriales bacterium]NQZ37215.1 hypothetical protein [Crocinitomicaceae bacterium]